METVNVNTNNVFSLLVWYNRIAPTMRALSRRVACYCCTSGSSA